MALMIDFPLKLKFLTQFGIFRKFVSGISRRYYGGHLPIELVVMNFSGLELGGNLRKSAENRKRSP